MSMLLLCPQGEGDSGSSVSMESVLAALAQMSLGGSGGAAAGAAAAGGAADEPRDDKPRLLCVEPAPPRHEKPQAEVCIYYTAT